jgi:flagellar motor switch protein FliN/FliY
LKEEETMSDNTTPESTPEEGPADALLNADEFDHADPLPNSQDFRLSHPGNINADVLQNISVTLAIEVGRANIKIKDLMRLTQGSVVELDRIAGEPLDLLVNETVVAQGEVVLVNDRYGIRLTRVVPSTERLKTL